MSRIIWERGPISGRSPPPWATGSAPAGSGGCHCGLGTAACSDGARSMPPESTRHMSPRVESCALHGGPFTLKQTPGMPQPATSGILCSARRPAQTARTRQASRIHPPQPATRGILCSARRPSHAETHARHAAARHRVGSCALHDDLLRRRAASLQNPPAATRSLALRGGPPTLKRTPGKLQLATSGIRFCARRRRMPPDGIMHGMPPVGRRP